MAGSPEPPELPDSGLKCRKCRSGFLAEIKHENGDGFKSTSDLFVFSEENMPDWILQKVEEAGWTKGRLNCPQCQSRLGGFDFISGADYPVHLIKSKVDCWKKPSTNAAENSNIVLVESPSGSPSSISSTTSSLSSYIPSEDSAENMTESEISNSELQTHSESKLMKRKRKFKLLQEKKKQRDYEKLMEKIMNAEPEINDLDASLICPVCWDLLFDPYVTVPCKHTFCETCLRRVGSKEPMNTQCSLCRQRIVYCEPQTELAVSIRESYPEIYHRRLTSEKSTNVYQMQLPWRPGWRTLVTGHGFGGNTLTATSYLDRIRKIVQLLPYYIPPVVIANLINMAFFCVLLGAVEILPFLNNVMMHKRDALSHAKLMETNFERNFGIFKESSRICIEKNGMTPNTFLEIVLHQSPRTATTASVMIDDIPLPPTYIPPQSTIQDLDATVLYVIAGMTILTMIFGNLIIWNFASLQMLFGQRQRYMTFWEFFGLMAMVLIFGYIYSSINPKPSQELWKMIGIFQFVGEIGEASIHLVYSLILRIMTWLTMSRLAVIFALIWLCINIKCRPPPIE